MYIIGIHSDSLPTFFCFLGCPIAMHTRILYKCTKKTYEQGKKREGGKEGETRKVKKETASGNFFPSSSTGAYKGTYFKNFTVIHYTFGYICMYINCTWLYIYFISRHETVLYPLLNDPLSHFLLFSTNKCSSSFLPSFFLARQQTL